MEKILIVDDNKYIRFIMSTLLESSGFEAVTAGDKQMALEEIKNETPQLIVLDKRLPDCDGIDLLEEIKSIHKDIPVIMLTAYAEEGNEERAKRAGAFAFMTKPFENNEIIATIEAALKKESN